METGKLKNIAIVILLLLNGFLLLLLGYQKLQTAHASRTAMEELTALFAAEELTLALPSDTKTETLVPLILTRQTETESRIAAFLLGEVVSPESQGGGIYSYRTEWGTVQFRAGGGFDTVRLNRDIGDAATFAHQFCDRFDYEDVTSTLENGSGTVTAVQYTAGVAVLESTLTMMFQDNTIVYAAGAHIDLKDAVISREEPLSFVSALTQFMDYRRENGIVCREITGIRCVYQLQSTVTPPRLLPAWEIETDTYLYLVDAMTAEVTHR